MPHRSRLCLFAALLLAVSACAVAPGGGRAPESGSEAEHTSTRDSGDVTAFLRVNVLPMTAGSPVLPDRTVLVRGGRIAEMGPAADVDVPVGALRVEGPGLYLMPGLADMHVHLEYFDDPELLKLFLAAGVTTVRNMDGRPYILEWRNRVADGRLAGPRIHTAGPILDGDPPMQEDNTVVESPAGAREAVRGQIAAGYDFIKVYTGLSAEAYRAVLETADELGVAVAGHIPGGVALEDAIAGGQRSIEHLVDYGEAIEAEDSSIRDTWHWSRLYLGIPADPARVEEAARLIANSNVWTVPTVIQADRGLAPVDSVSSWLSAPELAVLPPEARDFWEAQLRESSRRLDAEDWLLVERGRANRISLLAALIGQGARLLAGTDTPSPFVVPGYSLHQELQNFVAAGMTPIQALATATREAARFLGEVDERGTVEPGKAADLVLLRGDPSEDLSNLRDVVGVMIGGIWYHDEELPTIGCC